MENSRESRKKQSKGIRLLLFPLPLQGHINPMLQLANILYSKGFSITIIHTSFNSPNPSNYPDFTFQAIPDLPEPEFNPDLDTLTKLMTLNVTSVGPFHDLLSNMLGRNSGERIACLIVDAAWYFTRHVSESVGLPRIVLRTSNVSSFLVFDAWALLCAKGYIPVQDSRLEEAIVELPPLRVKDIPNFKTAKTDYFDHLRFNIMNETKASSGVIFNTFEELEKESIQLCKETFGIPIFTIGPFHKYPFQASSGNSSLLDQDQSSISWLDKQKPKSVLYVSFGSLAATDETEFLEIAWGLVNSKQPFLWVVRPGSVHGSDWLEFLPIGFDQIMGERGCIIKWAPQETVLSHQAVGGFWTHCGWNSTLESICEGVPMLCQPFNGDQKVDARYVTEIWRTGIHLEGKIERGEIERAIKRLIVDQECQEMNERALVLKDKAIQCLRGGGSSCLALDGLVSYILSF